MNGDALRNDPELQRLISNVMDRISQLLPAQPRQRIDRRVRLAGLVVTELMLVEQLRREKRDEPVRIPCPDCDDGVAVRHQRRERRFYTVCGPVTVPASIYCCELCGARSTPLHDDLGVTPGTDTTAALREVLAFLHAEEPVEVACEHVAGMLGFPIAPSIVHRAVQIEGARANQQLNTEGAAAAAGTTLPRPMPGNPTAPLPTGLREHRVGLVQLDGCMLHERPDWHETKLAVISDLGARVQRPPSPGEIARAALEGRQPQGREMLTRKSYVASNVNLEAGEEFTQRLYAEMLRWGLPWAEQVHTLSDGARWIPNQVRQLLEVAIDDRHPAPRLTFGLDWQHAEKHLDDAAAALPVEQRAERRRRWGELLWEHGDGNGVVALLREAAHEAASGESRNVLSREAEYFHDRRDMVDYPTMRAAGLPVSSGAVEGTCRHLVQSRLKRPGMSWSSTGAAGTLALRLYRRNGRWHELYADTA